MNLDFLSQDAVLVAEQLLGKKISTRFNNELTSGYIVETEAYTMDDPASHTFRGPTKRNAPMFGPAGHIYVYFTYGMHYCLNLVAGPDGVGQGVLIRAVQPLEGIEVMRIRRRAAVPEGQLTNGPGKVAQALGLTTANNGQPLKEKVIWLEAGITPGEIVQTTRVGISKGQELPRRYYIAQNPWVSKPHSAQH